MLSIPQVRVGLKWGLEARSVEGEESPKGHQTLAGLPRAQAKAQADGPGTGGYHHDVSRRGPLSLSSTPMIWEESGAKRSPTAFVGDFQK